MANKDKEKSSGKLKLVFLIIFVSILVSILGVVGIKYIRLSNKGNTETIIKEIKVPLGDEIMVNLSDLGGKRYLKAKVNISYDEKDKKAAKEIEEKNAEIKDKTIFYLKSKTVGDFSSDNEEILKNDLVAELNKIMNEGKIIDVYFDQLITQ